MKTFEPEDISKKTYSELLEARFEANQEKEDLEATVKIINEELTLRLKDEKLTGKVIDNWGISMTNRLTFKTDLEVARELGAVKEALDTIKLTKLYKSGVKIPGVEKITYLTVRDVSQKESA